MLQQVFTFMYQKKKYLPPVRKVVALQNKTDIQTQNLCIQYKQPQAQNLLRQHLFFNIIYIYIYLYINFDSLGLLQAVLKVP